MERFLVRNQVPKPDPGIANRAAKAKQHRKIEKIVDATLYKRKKLETRSAFLHDYPIEEPDITAQRARMVSTPYNQKFGGDRGPRVKGKIIQGGAERNFNTVMRVAPVGESGYGFMEVVGEQPAVPAWRKPGGQKVEAKAAVPGHTKYYRTTGIGGHGRAFDEVPAGHHLRTLHQLARIEKPLVPLAPGLVPPRMRALERK
jgi:hypothetical protein